MKKTIVLLMLAVLLRGAAYGADVAAGLIRFDPPQPRGCVAVRVDVPASKMLTGVRWRNGSASWAFPKILVASGNGLEPPAYSDAVVAVENVTGVDEGWSEVAFATPVASQSGTLFVVMEYPANYEPAAGGTGLGVGWSEEAAQYSHFVTGDGETWIKISGLCRVLVEPVLGDLEPGVALKSLSRGADEPVIPTRFGLSVAPNPFNPETRIDLQLPEATTGSVRVLDVRGQLVTELHRGPLAAGQNSFVWKGTDRSGNQVASGVYSVLVETSDQRHVKKVLLVK